MMHKKQKHNLKRAAKKKNTKKTELKNRIFFKQVLKTQHVIAKERKAELLKKAD